MPNPYLTFSSSSSFTLNVVDYHQHWDGTLEYSTDTTTWNTWDGTTTLNSASDGTNHNLYLRGTGNTYITGSSATSSVAKWSLGGSNISCNGNIENLLDYATVSLGNHPVMGSKTFAQLFRGNANLISAPELPATTLAYDCYGNMFQSCSSLTTAPSLPATTLADYCYYQMFYECFSLTSVPSLPASTLTYACYNEMFYGCSLLTTAPSLPATTLADYCYRGMFYNCTSLISLPELPATTLPRACYYEMFRDCTLIKVSTTQDSTYTNAYRIPSEGTGTSGTNSLDLMLIHTGGSFTGTPSINTTYYTSNIIIPAVEPTPQPSISIGTSALSKAFLGTTELSAIWLGNVKLYEETPAPSGYSVNVSNQNSMGEPLSISVYDGRDNTGIYLGRIEWNETKTFTITSGYIYGEFNELSPDVVVFYNNSTPLGNPIQIIANISLIGKDGGPF